MPPVSTDPNAIDLTQFKGRIDPCQFCKPEENILGRACTHCMAQGYLALCTGCNGSGKTTTGSVWDGGRSPHTSTCTPCGGKGYFPARLADYNAQPRPAGVGNATPVAAPPIPARIPPVVRPMPNVQIVRRNG